MPTLNFLSRFLTSPQFAHYRARFAVRDKEQTQPANQKHAPKNFTTLFQNSIIKTKKYLYFYKKISHFDNL